MVNEMIQTGSQQAYRFILTWLFVCCTFLFVFESKAQTKKLPNIILILTDDQGYHDVSYYGTKDILTPNIDALCREGIRMDNYYANSPVCSPTRASLMSGRYPDRVGVPGLIRSDPANNWGYLDPKTVLLPAQLKAVGYHTALIGKWNLGLTSPNLPNEKGFDLFHGWLEDMMEDYLIKRRGGKNYMRLNEQEIDPPAHATDLFTDWASEYILSRQKQSQPFFLYLAYNAPHFPVQPPNEWVNRVKQIHPEMSDKRAKLVALIEHLDEGIGKVIQTLKQTGAYENTLIIFSSDNGGNLPDLANNGPLRDGKQSMYEGGLKVPAFAVWPKKIKPGSVSQQVNTTMDVYPTLLDITGISPAYPLDGRSFLPMLFGKEIKESRTLYFVRREGGLSYGGKAYHAIREGDWKLLQNSPYQPLELYNLKEDPGEMKNLYNLFPEKVKALNNALMQQIQEGGKIPWQKPGVN